MSFDTTVVSRVQKVGSIVPLETRIYAVWFLNIEAGNILYNSVPLSRDKGTPGQENFFVPGQRDNGMSRPLEMLNSKAF